MRSQNLRLQNLSLPHVPRRAVALAAAGIAALVLAVPAATAFAQNNEADESISYVEVTSLDDAIRQLDDAMSEENYVRAERVIRQLGIVDDGTDRWFAALEDQVEGNPNLRAARALIYWNFRGFQDFYDDNAITDGEALYEEGPESLHGLIFSALGAAWQSETDIATERADEALRLGGSNPSVRYMVARVYNFIEPAKAIDQLQSLIEDYPGVPEYYLELATAYRWSGEIDQALTAVNQAIEIDPLQGAWYNNRAFIYEELGEDQAAILDYILALDLNPLDANSAYSFIVLAQETGDQNQITQAITAYIAARGGDETTRRGEPLRLGDPQEITLDIPRRIYSLPITLDEGQEVTISATAPEPENDPVLAILDPEGTPIAWNDDIDTAGGDYDALLPFTAEDAGRYTVLVLTTYNQDPFEVTVTAEEE